MGHKAEPAPQSGEAPIIDANAKFVRVTEKRADGFVAFDFAIGEPEIYVEMLLTEPDFRAFCAQNAVNFLENEHLEHADFEWRLRDAVREAAGPPSSTQDHTGRSD